MNRPRWRATESGPNMCVCVCVCVCVCSRARWKGNFVSIHEPRGSDGSSLELVYRSSTTNNYFPLVMLIARTWAPREFHFVRDGLFFHPARSPISRQSTTALKFKWQAMTLVAVVNCAPAFSKLDSEILCFSNDPDEGILSWKTVNYAWQYCIFLKTR